MLQQAQVEEIKSCSQASIRRRQYTCVCARETPMLATASLIRTNCSLLVVQ